MLKKLSSFLLGNLDAEIKQAPTEVINIKASVAVLVHGLEDFSQRS